MTDWTPQALQILEARYLLRDESGKVIESPDEMLWRVAREVSRAEISYPCRAIGGCTCHEEGYAHCPSWTERFYEIMSQLEFLPNSPCLANAGKPNGQLSACFVLPVEDSIVGIFDAVKNAALIHKTGGGTGFDFSKLRPRGSVVKSTGQIASGPVAFMRVFDAATEAIKQGGMRRGANMGVLRVDHPDVIDFINSKRDGGGIENFNISVAITDEFMADLAGCFDKNSHQNRWTNLPGATCACEVWKIVCQAAWETGDPGLWFVDRVNANRGNPVPSLGPIAAPNPCGEQELYDYDACTLGSINLAKFFSHTDYRATNWKRLREVVHIAVRFLDNTIDVNHYPLPEIEQRVKSLRRIGLGVMGWADMLAQRDIPYASERAVSLAEQVMIFIQREAEHASLELARERCSFPLFYDSIYRGLSFPGRRNATLTTIAPTGTISLIAGCSSGIEPYFAHSFQHGGLDGGLTEALIAPEGVQTAHKISYEAHVKMQAVFQEHVDNAVSKTINLPHNATVDDVSKAYLMAWEMGCKGVTVYRDGSKTTQVLTTKDGEEDGNMATDTMGLLASVPDPTSYLDKQTKRPVVLSSVTMKQPTPFGNAYITVGEVEAGVPFEVFVTIGKAGSDVQAMSEALGRVISHALRYSDNRRGTLVKIIGQLEHIGGSVSNGLGKDRVRSVPDAIAKALASYHTQTSPAPVQVNLEAVVHHLSLCPDCGVMGLMHVSGCEECVDCGYSRC